MPQASEPSRPEYVNERPDLLLPKAFARITNAEWESLDSLPLTGLQYRLVVLLLRLSRGAGRKAAAKASGEGHDAFIDADDDFGCEAVAVEAWQLAEFIYTGERTERQRRGDKAQVRRALWQLVRAGVVIRHSGGKGGRPPVAGYEFDDPFRLRERQILEVALDRSRWKPEGLR